MSNKNILFRKLTEKRRLLSQQLKNPAAVGFWNMVVDKYSDQAHFIYELLQNADDAKATEVRIILSEDNMQFIHNGTIPFSISDPDNEGAGANIGHLNAITSIGASAKQDGNTIGKFGVGFKSLFQYTGMPHVEDDFFSFRITDYIVPEEEAPVFSDRKKGETLFFIPFKNPARAFSDIEDKLLTLHKPQLFLRTLRRISWKTSRETHGWYSKEQEQEQIFQPENSIRYRKTSPSTFFDKRRERNIPCHVFNYSGSLLAKSSLSLWREGGREVAAKRHCIQYKFIRLQKATGDELQVEYLHTFTRNLSSLPACETDQSGTIAFFASAEGALLTAQPAEPAFCFFPTKEATGLNLILHAPFLLTDS